MCDLALRSRIGPDAAVRWLLTAVMSLVLAVLMLVSSQQASAQDALAEPYGLSRDEIVVRLDAGYAEAPVAGGITANGNILEVFASPGGASWTMIVTRPDGMSMVVAEGEGWSFQTILEGLRV